VTIGTRLAAAVAVVLVVSTTNAYAVGGVSTVNIVDAPRPQPKWGYAPGTRRVEPGTWVTWSNNGLDAHTVTALDGSFDSGDLDPSEGFSWFFGESGTFEYLCALHPWMAGKIVVGDGVAPPPDPSLDTTPAGDGSDVPVDGGANP